jgi:hypothetical protein
MWEIFCGIGAFITLARMFYNWGFDNGRLYHAQRAEEMLKREELRAVLDAQSQPNAQRDFGRRRMKLLD